MILDWMTDAACTTVDPEIFFAEESKGWRQMEAAKKICAGCPVIAECAADTPEDDHWSVRAGKTARQRARERNEDAA